MDGSGYLGLRVGDEVGGHVGAAPIFIPGRPRWYALRVRPQREGAAEAWLHRRGVYGFHPVLRRVALRFGKQVSHDERYLPGYVFARFQGEALPHMVTAGPFITGAICREGGDWGVLDGAELKDIHRMRAVDAETEARRSEAQIRLRRRYQLRPGGSARFRQGLFAGHSCEVVALRTSGRAMVRLSLFGREALVEAAEDDLVGIGVDSGDSPGVASAPKSLKPDSSHP